MELAILIGLPAAGKTSFVRDRLLATHVHASRDLLKTERNALRRQPLIALARAHGATVTGYVFCGTPGECLARNRLREPEGGRVPPAAVWSAFKRLEPPQLDEGFDRLYDVTLVSPAGFAVQERLG